MKGPKRGGLRRFFAPATIVLLTGLLATAGTLLPGSTWVMWACFGLALITLAVGCAVSPATAQLLVGLVGTAIPAVDWILKLPGRRREFRQVLDRMNGILRELVREGDGPPLLANEALEKIAESPVHDPRGDLDACVIAFAERHESASPPTKSAFQGLKGLLSKRDDRAGLPMANVYELLYRERHGPATDGLFGSLSNDQKDRVARLLAASGKLAPVALAREGTLRTELVKWALERQSPVFSVAALQVEFDALGKLSDLLLGYADYLAPAGITVETDLATLCRAVERVGAADLASRLGPVAVEVLSCEEDIGAWPRWRELATESTDAAATAAGLALVSLGIFTAEEVSPEHPLLAELARLVANADPETNHARRVLGAYLWERSRPDSEEEGAGLATLPPFQELATVWPRWERSLGRNVGSGQRRHLDHFVESSLKARIWPTYLPANQAADAAVLESRKFFDELERLAAKTDRDDEWRAALEELTIRIGKASGRPVEGTPRALDEIEAARLAFSEYLRTLVPDEEEPPETPTDVQRRLASFTAECRQEDHLAEHRSLFDTLELFRDRAADLSRQLEEMFAMLKGELRGGSAYLVTFDQVNGRIAKVINRLQFTYSFKNYTKFTRLGRLDPDETFEAFYKRFQDDLEREIQVGFGNVDKVLNECDTDYLADAKRRFLRALEAVASPLFPLEANARPLIPPDAAAPKQRVWRYRPGIKPGPKKETFDHFVDRARADLGQELKKTFPKVPTERRAEAVEGWLKLSRPAAVWDRVEVTVQQVSLLHRHDFAVDALGHLTPNLGRSYAKVFRLPPSSALVEATVLVEDLERRHGHAAA